MKSLKEVLFENRFFKNEQETYTAYSNVIDICSELALSVSEFYAFKKNSEELEYKSFTVDFMADLSDSIAFPMNYVKLPEIGSFIESEFGRFGKADVSGLGDEGSFSIEREEPLLSLNEDFLNSLEKYKLLLLKEFQLRIKQ